MKQNRGGNRETTMELTPKSPNSDDFESNAWGSQQDFTSNNSVIVYLWRASNLSKPRIGLKIKFEDEGCFPYIGYNTREKHHEELVFGSLCVDSMMKTYDTYNKKYHNNQEAWENQEMELIKVKTLLDDGGVGELSSFYIRFPRLIQSFILLIAGGLLLIADNDLAKMIGVMILSAFVALWSAGIWQRSRCRRLDAATYFDRYLKPAHRWDQGRKMPLKKNRNQALGSGMLCSLALAGAGGILFSMPDKFVLSPKVNVYASVGAILLGLLCCCSGVSYSVKRCCTDLFSKSSGVEENELETDFNDMGEQFIYSSRNRVINQSTNDPSYSLSVQ